MACTSQPLATMVAIDILKKGGNAIDAAIAANAMLGLVEPMSCGVGGDIFVILWDAKTKRLYGLNGSGRSPKNLTLAQLKEMGLKKIPIHGPLAVSVPGCVDGWFELSNKFGKLPMSEILAPTIEYAKNGFPVSELIAAAWAEEVKDLRESPGFLETFSIKGNAPAKGDIFKNPLLQTHLKESQKMVEMNFTKEKRRNKSLILFKQMVDLYPKKISQIIIRNGLNQFLQITVDTMFGNYHQTGKELLLFKCST